MTQPSFSSFDAALIVRDSQGQNLLARWLTRFRKPTSCHRAWVYPREVLKCGSMLRRSFRRTTT